MSACCSYSRRQKRLTQLFRNRDSRYHDCLKTDFQQSVGSKQQNGIHSSFSLRHVFKISLTFHANLSQHSAK